jgi:hypothetical protein
VFGLALAHLLNSLVRNSGYSPRRVRLGDTSKNTSKVDRCSGLMLGFSIPRDSFPGKFGIELAPYVFVIAEVFSVVPLADNRLEP